MGFYFNAILIASVVCLAAPAHAQVKVITGEIEHIYGPGGQLLDNAELRARNERAERARRLKEARPRSSVIPVAKPAPISGQSSI
jgi:hypothetical protein